MKLTKTELRAQQHRMGQLQKYLPTLQLKKALLQMEVGNADAQIEALTEEFRLVQSRAERYAPLLTDPNGGDLFSAIKIQKVECRSENIAGVDVPIYERTLFHEVGYALFDSPVWLESGIDGMHRLLSAREQVRIAKEKRELLARELREVSIRVNLFEKILIPRAQENIKKIKIFLSDQQLAAVCQAKVAKTKIERR